MIGQRGAGFELAIKAAEVGLWHTLCRTSRTGRLSEWRQKLEKFLVIVGSKIVVPQSFPNPTAVRNYNQPWVSDKATMRNLAKVWWPMPLHDLPLLPLLGV